MSGISAMRFSGVRNGSNQALYGDGDAWPVVAPFYASVEALLAAVNVAVAGNMRADTNPCALVERFEGGGEPSRMIRQQLTALFQQTTGGPFTFRERLWGLMPLAFEPAGDGGVVVGVETHYLGEAVYTFAAEPEDFGVGLGAPSGIGKPSGLTFTPSPAGGSLLKALTGGDVEVPASAPPAGSSGSLHRMCVYDVGPLLGLLRVFRHDGGAGENGWYALPMRGEWR